MIQTNQPRTGSEGYQAARQQPFYLTHYDVFVTSTKRDSGIESPIITYEGYETLEAATAALRKLPHSAGLVAYVTQTNSDPQISRGWIRATRCGLQVGQHFSAPRGGNTIELIPSRGINVCGTESGQTPRLNEDCRCGSRDWSYFEFLVTGLHGFFCESCRRLTQVG